MLFNLSPCWNGAACAGSSSSFTCTCKSGYSGSDCKTVSTVSCNKICQNGGICYIESSVSKCFCQTGFTGANCESRLNDPTAKPYIVRVYNKAGYTAIVTLTSGTQVQKATITSGRSATIQYTGSGLLAISALSGQNNFLLINITQSNRCYDVWGTTLYPAYAEMGC